MSEPKINANQAIEIVETYIKAGGYFNLIDRNNPPEYKKQNDGKYCWMVHTYMEYQDQGAVRDGYMAPGIHIQYTTYVVDEDTLSIDFCY